MPELQYMGKDDEIMQSVLPGVSFFQKKKLRRG